MIRRPPRSTHTTHSFPTRRSSDLLRLHLVILGVTFLAFPVFVVLLQMLMPGFVAQPLWAGMLFLAALPSTVQSSIAFTSMARGNVAGAVVAAAASNMLGIDLTPFIVKIGREQVGTPVTTAHLVCSL